MNALKDIRPPRFIRLIHVFATCVAVLLAACASRPVLSTLPPVPTLQTIRLGYPPAMLPWAQAATVCAASLPDVALFPTEIADTAEANLEIRLAYYSELDAGSMEFVYSLGQENLVLVKNLTNPVTAINAQTILAIYSGSYQNWGEIIPSNLQTTSPFTSTIFILSYPPDDPLQSAFSAAINSLPPPHAQLVPDPGAMLQIISEEPGSLGYVPDRWLNGSYRASAQQVEGLTIQLNPVAYSMVEPEGAVKALLSCLQNP